MRTMAQRTSGTILVYLCNGEVKVLPEGRRVDVQSDIVVCLDEHDREVARFRAQDVYMCTSKPVPRALL